MHVCDSRICTYNDDATCQRRCNFYFHIIGSDNMIEKETQAFEKNKWKGRYRLARASGAFWIYLRFWFWIHNLLIIIIISLHWSACVTTTSCNNDDTTGVGGTFSTYGKVKKQRLWNREQRGRVKEDSWGKGIQEEWWEKLRKFLLALHILTFAWADLSSSNGMWWLSWAGFPGI